MIQVIVWLIDNHPQEFIMLSLAMGMAIGMAGHHLVHNKHKED